MSAIIQFLKNPYVQVVFWIAAAAVALKFITMPEISGGGNYWRKIAIGILLYGVRVSFKILPFYSSDVLWTQVARYVIGIIAAFFLILGFVEYYYRNLRDIMKMKEEA